MIAIGMMSGTSFDGIDAAAARFTVESDTVVLEPIGMVSGTYSDKLQSALTEAMSFGQTTLEEVCRLDTEIGQAFADIAVRANDELCEGHADLIASHGQTLFHWVDGSRVRGTLQLGQPAWIAERTGCTVISDFRSRDVAAGGQGAPLVSAFDSLWLRGRPGRPVALNLGGIANVTVVEENPAAFDTGPANALIDAAVLHFSNGTDRYDEDGRLAATGKVHDALLGRLMDEPYFSREMPKSTGKELFNLNYLLTALDGLGPIPAEDVITTVTALTARTVAAAVIRARATEVIASGGGTRNPTLMAMLRSELPTIDMKTSDDIGLPSGAKEAYAFAMLGWCTANGFTSTVPSCTGANHASVLGSITPGRRGFPVAAGQRELSRLRVITR
jgi:anhydro-N-acetylmuramic acid kinase